MALKMGSAYVDIEARLDKLEAAFNRAKGKTTSFGNVIQGILQGVGQRLFDGIVRGAEFFIDKMGKAVTASSNLNEEINKTGVIFGSSADEVIAWSKTTTDAMGVSQTAALTATGQFGALFRQMGQIPAVAAANSQELVQLAADLSSIYNIPIDVALEKLRSGLAGETEPLRAVNIFLTDQAVRLKAVSLGLAESTDAVSEAAKVEARRILILDQGAIAMGDQARTVRELAGAQRKLAAEIEDGSAALGNSFRPAVAAITNLLVDLAPSMFTYAQNITDQFANGLAAGIRAIIPVITTIRQLFTYWFAPGSPPRILPDIDIWGRGTMQAWLDGMATVDVKKAFDTVGRAVEGVLRSFVGAGKMDESGLVSAIFGSRDAIAAAVAEFKQLGSVSASTIQRIASSAGPAGAAISTLVKTYFELQRASEKVKQAQDALNRTTEEYDAIINPLRNALDDVRGQQQALANQQRLISAQNTLSNFESTAAEKQAAQLEIQQIALENQLAAAEDKKDAAVEAGQAAVDVATAEEEAAKKQLDAAQAVIDNQVEVNNLLGQQLALEKRLADEREAAAKKAEAEAEKAAREAEQLYQAQLSYQLGIASGEEKLAILRNELNRVPKGSVEYFQLLGQIADQEEANTKEAERNSAKLTDAQLDYNLALASTAGKIAIWQQELAKVAPGSAEYFRILTTIVGLQDQLDKELNKLGLTDIGPGLDTGVMAPLDEVKGLTNDLAAAFGDLNTAMTGPLIGKIPEAIKALADSLEALGNSTAFQKISEALHKMGVDLGLIKEEEPQVFFTSWADAAEGGASRIYTASAKIDEGSDKNVEKLIANIGIVTALMNGDWAEAWRLYKEYAITAYGDVDTETTTKLARLESAWALFSSLRIDAWAELFRILQEKVHDFYEYVGTWFGNIQTTIGEKFASIGTTFGTLQTTIGDFFKEVGDGFGSLQTIIEDFYEAIGNISLNPFTSGLQGLVDLLPGSEPKDPSSPLRGLKDRGAAFVENFQAGMDQASLNVNSLAGGLLPAPAGATTTNNSTANNMSFNITINGATNADEARNGAQTGILDALRAAGMR